MGLMSIDFRGISSQSASPSVPVFHGSMDNSSAPVAQCHFSVYLGAFVVQRRTIAAICQAGYGHP